MSERAGTIFGAARIGSPFAIATSVDDGTTWQPFMRYEDVGAIAGCVQAVCEDVCLTQAAIHLWPSQMCESPQSAGASGGAGGPPDAAIDGPVPSMAAGKDDERPGGCTCSFAGAPQPARWGLALLVIMAWLVTGLRSRPRGRRSRDGAGRS
jgi:hypothetical protein